MGFGTTLRMYNLRLFLNKLVTRLADEGIDKLPGISIVAHSHNLKGFGPQTSDLEIKREGVILYGIDAADDEGYSCYGEETAEGYPETQVSIDKENLDASVEAIKLLINSK